MDVIKERQATLWGLMNRGYAVLHVAHKKDWAGLDNPAILKLQNDVNLFCLEFAIDYELERATWLEAAEKKMTHEADTRNSRGEQCDVKK